MGAGNPIAANQSNLPQANMGAGQMAFGVINPTQFGQQVDGIANNDATTAVGGMGNNVNQFTSNNGIVNSNLSTLGTGQTKNPYFGSTNPYITAAQATTMGNLYGAESATAANRVNQNTPYGSLEFIKGVDANGNPTWTANQTLSPQLKALTETSLAGLQSSLDNPMYGINPGQTYSDAILTRLQPQINQSNERLQAQLANQGIVPGTEAYNRAMTLQGQTTNDLLTSAITGGMQTGLAAQKLQNEQAGNIKALSTPGYVNPYSQAAVAGPDYLGAYTTSEAARIAQQNAEAAKNAGLQTGLFGLGGAALLGSGGIGGLLGLGSQGIDWLSNFGNTDYLTSIGATSSGMYDPAMSTNDYLENLYGNLGIF